MRHQLPTVSGVASAKCRSWIPTRPLSISSRSARKSPRDSRVQHTQRALHEALLGLVREKDFDHIAVREILSRAQVGRSTFYAHFADKDELLINGIEQILARSDAGDSLTSFSLAIFEHHDQHRRTGSMSRRARALLHERLRTVIVGRIQDSLQRSARKRHASLVPAALLAQFIATTFVIVLNWWLDTRSPLPPAEVNDLFCSLVRSGH